MNAREGCLISVAIRLLPFGRKSAKMRGVFGFSDCSTGIKIPWLPSTSGNCEILMCGYPGFSPADYSPSPNRLFSFAAMHAREATNAHVRRS